MSTSSKNNLDRIKNSMSNLSFRNYDHNKIINPQTSARSDESRSYGRSVFLTNFDKMQKTKALWRNTRNVQKPKNNQLKSITSLLDLNKMKIKYRMEILKRKSKQQIFQQNMEMIEKLEQTPPKVDTWNYYKPKRSSKGSVQNIELFEKNMELIKRIQTIVPKVQNWNYYKRKKSLKALERTNEKFRILDENMKMIQRVQSVPPRVDAWSFKKFKRDKKLMFQRQLKNQRIFQQNMKIIQRVQSTSPKVVSWTDIKSLQNKVKRMKTQNSYEQKLNLMKKLIEQGERKILKKDISSEERTNRKYKTLPTKIPAKILKKSEERERNNKRLTIKIQKTKCAIDCWSKPLNKRPNIDKVTNKNKNSSKNVGILSSIKQRQQMKNLQVKTTF